jgi:hypothetical protein
LNFQAIAVLRECLLVCLRDCLNFGQRFAIKATGALLKSAKAKRGQ